ncbi:hypothetical protein PpBr36_03516 [Pyricularia pennisetigena]|uniref:hypothetical protein n=1 Tax=Pyricularia pennisetigena TaxID=1578925 RepID=UPI0011548844|nr:hypothetical protein PpBr36_03516 [Pyricularia pennisetigena]TLS30830.1 hypothetical protein PpBr36_03516 [Pyricularia pennisetigena]
MFETGSPVITPNDSGFLVECAALTGARHVDASLERQLDVLGTPIDHAAVQRRAAHLSTFQAFAYSIISMTDGALKALVVSKHGRQMCRGEAESRRFYINPGPESQQHLESIRVSYLHAVSMANSILRGRIISLRIRRRRMPQHGTAALV